MKKRNSEGWKLISTSSAIVDSKNQFSNLYTYLGKEIISNTIDIRYLISVDYMHQNFLTH